jgi:hypothetical protein
MNNIPDLTPEDNPNVIGYDEYGCPIYTNEYMKEQMKKPVDYADIYNSIVTIKEKELKDKAFDAMLKGTISSLKEEKLSQKDIEMKNANFPEYKEPEIADYFKEKNEAIEKQNILLSKAKKTEISESHSVANKTELTESKETPKIEIPKKHNHENNVNARSDTRQEILKNAQELDEEYLALIDTVEIVTARLMLKLDPEANIKTVRSRLNRLVDQKKIKQKKPNKISGGQVCYHSNNYKPSALDRHNLWIASTMIWLFNNDFDAFSDKDILKNLELKNFRFNNGVLDYNFIPDIVGIKDNYTVAVEVEISRKTGKKKSKEFQDKIEAYVYSLRTGKFSEVQYYTDDNYIIKQFEKWKSHYKGDDRLNIYTVTDEELLII